MLGVHARNAKLKVRDQAGVMDLTKSATCDRQFKDEKAVCKMYAMTKTAVTDQLKSPRRNWL